MRRKDRAKALLNGAERWDLVVLDEAHHARRRAAGSAREGKPNSLLKLMLGLKDRTQGLVLLTATPMQVHPIEVWDLLNLLGLPSEWTSQAFLRFVSDSGDSNPSPQAMYRLGDVVPGGRTRLRSNRARNCDAPSRQFEYEGEATTETAARRIERTVPAARGS